MFEYLDLCLPEIGRVKIGQKGEKIKSQYGKEFQKPEKLDYFKIVTLKRGKDGNFETDTKAHEVYGEKPQTLKIKPLSDKIQDTIQGGYALYSGKGERMCFGDGRTGNHLIDKSTGEIEQISCPCKQYEQGFCKKWAKASFVLKGVGGLGGIHTMKIQGKITVPAFIGSFKAIYDICQAAGVSIANTELELKLREVQTKMGKVYSPYFFFPGTAEELIASAKKLPTIPSTNFGVLTEETDEAEETENLASDKTETEISENVETEIPTATTEVKTEKVETITETKIEATKETEIKSQEVKPTPADSPKQPENKENLVGEVPTKKWETKENKTETKPETKEETQKPVSTKQPKKELTEEEKRRAEIIRRINSSCKRHYALNNTDAVREVLGKLIHKKVESSADLTDMDLSDLNQMFNHLDEHPDERKQLEEWIFKVREERRFHMKEEAKRKEMEENMNNEEAYEDEADETEYGAE